MRNGPATSKEAPAHAHQERNALIQKRAWSLRLEDAYFFFSCGVLTSTVGTWITLFSVPTFTAGPWTLYSGSWPPLTFTSTSGIEPFWVFSTWHAPSMTHPA